MKFKNILYKLEKDGTAEVVLNRPEKMNSLDETLITDLTELFGDISNNKSIKSVVLTGAGGNFCSGLYLDYLQKISTYGILENKIDSEKFRDMLLSIYNCSKPVIAKVSGYAIAGGCGIASACDIIVADETAIFGYTEVKIGFIPAIVMVFLLKRISETHAKELLLTSRMLSSKDAHRIGLINYSVPKGELDSKVSEICGVLAGNSPSSISLTKEMFTNISGMNFNKALDYACSLNAITRMTEDCKSGIAKFLDKDIKKK
jgi:methylglutaconyl-CoA hydratase